MRNLDPGRFPGITALVELMHQQLVSNDDALELQLRRQLDENRGGTIRNTDPTKVPAGYQDSVAEYYRRTLRLWRPLAVVLVIATSPPLHARTRCRCGVREHLHPGGSPAAGPDHTPAG